jgi:hypothetical protein
MHRKCTIRPNSDSLCKGDRGQGLVIVDSATTRRDHLKIDWRNARSRLPGPTRIIIRETSMDTYTLLVAESDTVEGRMKLKD